MKMLIGLGISAALASASLSPAWAAEKKLPLLSPVFASNMVLQRDHKDEIWGWASPGSTVTVTLDSKAIGAVAGSDGKWMASLPSRPAGGPCTIDVVSGEKTVHLDNVLFGDVWICSGQSNMQIGINTANNGSAELAAADHPQIRLFMAPDVVASTPQPTVGGTWAVCSPATFQTNGWSNFSAVGYYFGRDLQKEINVPIGLVETCWGGTPAESWTSAEALKTMKDFANVDQGLALVEQGQISQPQNVAAALYNAMIAPFIPMGIKGVIWYQGESNVGRADQYSRLLPAMIDDWRHRWNQGDFPFLIVQISSLSNVSMWPELREAQYKTTRTVRNTGLAVTIDIGDANDIHPKNKQEVGRRLSLIALAKDYRRNIEFSGPEFDRQETENSRIRLHFKQAGGGLTAKPNTAPQSAVPPSSGALRGFAIAGKDRVFAPATAAIDGDTVVVSSPDVAEPRFVRYAWDAYPDCNLYNAAGLPAIPFRTDSAAGLTRTAGLHRKLTIHHATGPVALDGTLAGFPEAAPEKIADRDLVLGEDPGGIGASFRMCWDENAVYLWADVTDPTPMQNTYKGDAIWRADAFEVFFGPDTKATFGPLLTSDRQALLSAAKVDGDFQSFITSPPGTTPPAQPGIKMIVIPHQNGKGYVTEAAIPFDRLSFTPADGREILFDLGIDDSADGTNRVRQLMWSGTFRDSVDRGDWGLARFVK